MIVLTLLVLASVSGVVAALRLPGWMDLILIFGPCALASIFLLLRAIVRRYLGYGADEKAWVVVDGSNVMHWKDQIPQIETVNEVVRHLADRGFTTGVMFDANAGYLMFGKYLHDGDLGRLMGLASDRVMVVPKGTPADPYILTAARDLGAQIVTNDRFRDWAEDYPEIHDPMHLIRGEYRAGDLWLDLESGENQ